MTWQVLYSLPHAHAQRTTRRLLSAEQGRLAKHGCVPAGALSRFLLLLGAMAQGYDAERSAFLQRLASQRSAASPAPESDVEPGTGTQGGDEAVLSALKPRVILCRLLFLRCSRPGHCRVRLPEIVCFFGRCKHMCAASTSIDVHLICVLCAGEDSAFDYMQAEEVQREDEAAADAYIAELTQDTAPACYLPHLAALAAQPEVPDAVRVRMTEALNEQLTQIRLQVNLYLENQTCNQCRAAVSNPMGLCFIVVNWPACRHRSCTGWSCLSEGMLM